MGVARVARVRARIESKVMKPSHVVLFADVDHSFFKVAAEPYSEAVRRLVRSEGISLVLCSSMTRAELEVCQQELEIRQPFVCESGAAIFVPRDYFSFEIPSDRELAGYRAIEFGRRYAEVLEMLHRAAARARVGVVGFSDLSVEQVAADCGLSLSQARLSKLREYDEPIRPIDALSRDRFCRALASARLAFTYLRVYEHVGAAVDKGKCVGLLTALYRRAFGSVITIGVGEAAHSAALLQRVKFPFVVQRLKGDESAHLLAGVPRLHLDSGSSGWLETIAAGAQQALGRQLHRMQAAG
jgi:mannosyl-3-phosphoglycerate phosphatase